MKFGERPSHLVRHRVKYWDHLSHMIDIERRIEELALSAMLVA